MNATSSGNGAAATHATIQAVCAFPSAGTENRFPGPCASTAKTRTRLTRTEFQTSFLAREKWNTWTFENGGGGWDHPIHLHFEEGVTIDRGGANVPNTERLARKDVWRLREGGKVKVQVQFGEYGGAYVNHCHNTVHEDFAMLYRYDVLKDDDSIHATVIPLRTRRLTVSSTLRRRFCLKETRAILNISASAGQRWTKEQDVKNAQGVTLNLIASQDNTALIGDWGVHDRCSQGGIGVR